MPQLTDSMHVLDALLAVVGSPRALPSTQVEAAMAAHNCLVLSRKGADGIVRVCVPQQVGVQELSRCTGC